MSIGTVRWGVTLVTIVVIGCVLMPVTMIDVCRLGRLQSGRQRQTAWMTRRTAPVRMSHNPDSNGRCQQPTQHVIPPLLCILVCIDDSVNGGLRQD